MQRGELAFWVAFVLSGFALLFPHLAATHLEDPRPLRMMALAVFIVTGAALADSNLLGGYVWDSLAGSPESGR